jgi:uncharacterized membrane protein
VEQCHAVTERPHPLLLLVAAGAALGLLFAGVSTADFVQHLDRQVHALHCSFIPGLGAADASGTSGCQVTMMSPYSSLWRSHLWGGVPISLPAMSVFAFLLFFAAELWLTGRQTHRRATGFLALACALPAATSLFMGLLSLAVLDAACKLCIGIYVASALCLGGSVALWRRARAGLPAGRPGSPGAHGIDPDGRERQRAGGAGIGPRPGPVSARYLVAHFAIGVLFVLIPIAGYLWMAPDHERFIGSCGRLERPEDSYQVMVPLDGPAGQAFAIEVLDPLCPACRAFEQRLDASGLGQRLQRKALLFPLDNSCNWMVDSAVHPGACAVSEAVLCAGDRAREVLDWAFAEQESLRGAAAAAPARAAEMVRARFPDLARCLGSAGVRARLNKSLRWAVRNRLPVLTPQLYVDGVKLCDEDTDLGLDFALSHLLDRHARGALQSGGTR